MNVFLLLKRLNTSTMLLLTGLSAFSGTSWAQDAATVESLDARVNRIERVLDQSMLEQFQRVERLEQEIRGLRGEIESLTFEMNSLSKRSSDLYDDTNIRITDLEEARDSNNFLNEDGSLSEDAFPDESTGLLDETATDGGADNATAGLASPATVIVREGGSVTPIANIEQFEDGPTPPTTAVRNTATNAEKLAYNSAYDQLADGKIQDSISSFDAFLTQYPDGPFSDNAWYWQGEAMYAQREFDKALRNFNVVINAFPDSPKVPDARLKIGFAFYEKQQYEQARAMLTGVQDDYPGRSASVLARTRLQEMDREGQ